jgi:hypothetical protein
MQLLITLPLVVLALVVIVWAVVPIRVQPGAVAIAGVPPSGRPADLIAAYLTRSNWFRRLGAVAGFFMAVQIGIVFHGEVGISTGTLSLFADVLAMPMLGSLAGVIVAETYNIRRRYRGPRIADLTDRSGRYRAHQAAARFRRAAAVAAAVSLAALAATPSAGSLLVVIGSVALAVEIAQRYLERRPRPALSSELAAADDAIRRIAALRLDRSGLGIAVLVFGWAAIAALGFLDSILVGLVFGIGSLVAAFRIWRSVGRIPDPATGAQPA